MMESATKTIRGTAAKYAVAYIALAALSVAGGRQVALLNTPTPPIAAAQSQTSLGSIELAAASGKPPGTPGKGPGSGAAQKPFTMTGSVSDLKPGQPTHLPVVVTNPNNQAIKIETLTTSVGNASADCTASNLSVGAYNASTPGSLTYTVPGNGSATVILPIEFADTAGNQDACKGLTFPLYFDGTAVQHVAQGSN